MEKNGVPNPESTVQCDMCQIFSLKNHSTLIYSIQYCISYNSVRLLVGHMIGLRKQALSLSWVVLQTFIAIFTYLMIFFRTYIQTFIVVFTYFWGGIYRLVKSYLHFFAEVFTDFATYNCIKELSKIRETWVKLMGTFSATAHNITDL